ncbi:undecaprenyldiphospho-muramoylpentapeptide beta-N-acetylglucosaminyltransferase [Falsibacillus albus]|uniref:UDP-N-acetylglucosamine--N-acetylmuramyl-(pentapeptide) pyrophosphoryl-undecaprenol N-acetylglucosamine transferase n=1 Tax=Falsibacillus albus TaxID=2478915 RepID=A0A3L7JZ68_9BACI|nr:undecaprenyldiphospho-muramoylpentapeptide beta-N-acetylglucosaminyltransferase [Falsibacillus albus]RLQ95830.1 undecaprenyldiphospho-muramoylpentapeptide beta-N-acetylglucosaminyltransferase [Falsibacillus albus]
MKIIVSGGGTGGHIYPALAFIRTIKQKHPDTEFLYIGTSKGLESKLVTREEIPFKSIEITGFKRSISFENVKTVLRFLKGVKESRKIIREFKPDMVIGTGGYVCGPVVYAAAKENIPSIVHEQNSVPGLTNKFLSKYVDKVAICFESATGFFPKEKVVLTGNPRASEVAGIKKTDILARLGLTDLKPSVLIFGGSRGARPINEAVVASLESFAQKPYQVIYVTGDVHFDKVKKEAEAAGELKNVVITPFLHNMPEVLRSVDAVVSRAGATSIAEFTALGVPSLLIPSPYVTNNHQEKNARALVEKDAASLLLESELTSENLVRHIDQIVLDAEKKKRMSESAKQLGMPDATSRLYNVMLQLTGNRQAREK